LKVPKLRVCETSWDRRPIVEFDPLPAQYTYELYKDGDADPYTTITQPGYNYYRPSSPLGSGGPPPGSSMTIHLVSCMVGKDVCCGTSESVTVSLIEDCTNPVQPSADNVAISEYVIDGDGVCPSDDCEAGEAFEITNLSNCPVSLSGNHFSYSTSDGTAVRWMDFDNTAVVPPRGVYVAIRNLENSSCDYPFFGQNEPGLFGLNVSVLEMESTSSLASGWFNNLLEGRLRVASGWFVDMISGETFFLIDSYLTDASQCQSVGFNAWDACGNITGVLAPNEILNPNQLGRLWHPCDAVLTPVPADCLD
jgi:hypothetical protein